MNSKKTAIIAIAVLAIVISSLGAVSAFELFGMNLFGSSTDFDNKFMSGTFNGEVIQNEIKDNGSTKGWTDSYSDNENNITYNMTCVKDGNFITDVYQLQGLGAPEVRNYNGQPWKIFYSQAVPDNNVTDNKTSGNDTNNTINVYICEADINGTAYTINVMAYDNKTECDGTLFCPLYKDYIGPLVESIKFKDAKKAPEMSDLLGMSDEEFKFNKDYVDGILNGTIDPSKLQ
ncbi:hypothetical protein [Methanobrevibacter sp.]|uniref:hypothetical protein n=1 Tax=Methanobrevibacter sp. TaxID=66852 RepID=UPI0038643A6D